MITATKSFWKNYVNFTDRSSRSEYWFAALSNLILDLIGIILTTIGTMRQLTRTVVIVNGVPQEPHHSILLIIGIIWLTVLSFATLIPTIAITVRRVRDAGLNPWFTLAWLIPIAGGFIIFIFTLLPSKITSETISKSAVTATADLTFATTHATIPHAQSGVSEQ